ncbi:MAG: lasso peptide biosynthesis B2 protein [Alphaproteobacteria bacterium]|nr:lasso peptide biosynthesis B2 protein [Alphaproteobacteria bacterium]
MNYHLSDHIYVTQFREELILLDTKKDKYTICFKEFSELLMNVLGRNDLPSNADPIAPSHSQNFLQRSTYIQKLLDDGVLMKDASPYPFYIDQKPHSEGISNVDWRLPLENKNVGLTMHVLRALSTLIKVNIYIKLKGLYSTIQLVKKSRNTQSTYIIPQEGKLKELANVVTKACLMYPSRTKCLEWAMTFVLMALKRKWKCNLEIGVQNYPFMAHAWVECNGKADMDSQDLREKLGIILNEPFRKAAI